MTNLALAAFLAMAVTTEPNSLETSRDESSSQRAPEQLVLGPIATTPGYPKAGATAVALLGSVLFGLLGGLTLKGRRKKGLGRPADFSYDGFFNYDELLEHHPDDEHSIVMPEEYVTAIGIESTSSDGVPITIEFRALCEPTPDARFLSVNMFRADCREILSWYIRQSITQAEASQILSDPTEVIAVKAGDAARDEGTHCGVNFKRISVIAYERQKSARTPMSLRPFRVHTS